MRSILQAYELQFYRIGFKILFLGVFFWFLKGAS